ncbi:GNAT family N-acetyltransferase, partial [archaeon]
MPMYSLSAVCRSMICADDLSILCDSEGRPASIAIHSAIVDDDKKLSRIGSVYTDPEHRGKGLAGAVTHHVAQQILKQGVQPMLYAQVPNKIGNKLY